MLRYFHWIWISPRNLVLLYQISCSDNHSLHNKLVKRPYGFNGVILSSSNSIGRPRLFTFFNASPTCIYIFSASTIRSAHFFECVCLLCLWNNVRTIPRTSKTLVHFSREWASAKQDQSSLCTIERSFTNVKRNSW